MEKKSIQKVRWYLRYKTQRGWETVLDSKGVRYFDSFQELASVCAARIDANPSMQFQFIKDTYWVSQ